ncbi:O-methyltransferase [Fulvivirga sediminis]|uniref:Class I SAM-dependent methyltransferase n=1 Tax=Fulvivirga sediminis TaxID=2803949 RepID=A0A937F8C1_9BACT|nr:class I SAM-dependent methyltransferase [Fulvivirga sediminis]MBL3657590.1 class I SAM-dependent methyltransferase [Fulvivirga sediminis]
MQQKIQQLKSFIWYWLKAENKHSLHPPFVFALYTSVFQNQSQPYCFKEIKKAKRKFQKSQQEVQITDLGAGSSVANSATRKVSQIASSGITRAKYSQLLYKLCRFINAQHVVELGTSIGINTLYLSYACENGSITTYEGAPELAKIAEKLFEEHQIKNVRTVIGNIDETLKSNLPKSVDLAFFDANHKATPTLTYFHTLLAHAHEDSCFIFDDIHWSAEMERAWEEIKNHPSVSLSIDIFQFGIILFKKGIKKQHYILQY